MGVEGRELYISALTANSLAKPLRERLNALTKVISGVGSCLFCVSVDLPVFHLAGADGDFHLRSLLAYIAYAWGTNGLTAGTIAGHLAAVKYFYRQELGIELFLCHPWIVDALKGVTCSHIEAGTKSRIPRPVAWSVLLAGKSWCHQWGPRGAGAVTSTRDFVFLCSTAGEMFASNILRRRMWHILRRRMLGRWAHIAP